MSLWSTKTSLSTTQDALVTSVRLILHLNFSIGIIAAAFFRTFPWLNFYVFSLSLEFGRSGDLRCAGNNLLYVRQRHASDCRDPDHLADYVTDTHRYDTDCNHTTCGLLTVLPEMDARNLALNSGRKRQDEHTRWRVYLQHPHCQGLR